MFRKPKDTVDANVNVLSRQDIVHIETDKVKFTFGEIPDASLDSKELIGALVKHDFEVGTMKKDEPDYSFAVTQLKKQLRNIKTDYAPFQIVIDRLDPDGSYDLKVKVRNLFNRIIFFQIDSLLLDFGRYVFSYYAVLQLKNVQSIFKKFNAEKSDDIAAQQINSINFLEPNGEQMNAIMSELDNRIEDHRKEIDSRKEPGSVSYSTPLSQQQQQQAETPPVQQQAAGNAGYNPIKTLTDKFTEKQNNFIDQRKRFKTFVNMLLELLTTSLDQVIEIHEKFMNSAQIDDELKDTIKSIIVKIEDGIYHLKPDENIDKDLEELDSAMISQIGKRGTVRYKNILSEIDNAVNDIRKQNGFVQGLK